jgi:UDP-N-acetylmuramyl tripeptide synthase
MSDVAILTSDNPRDEDPLSIIAEVRAGVAPGSAHHDALIVEPDRRLAIRRILDEARRGDVVVIAGKGHETTQEIGDERFPFDDVAEARQSLARRFSSDPVTWTPERPTDGTLESR